MKTKNKIFTVFLALFLAIAIIPSVMVNAENDLIRIVDWADLLSDSEETELSDKLDEISERQQVDVVVVTVDSLEGMTAMEYADDFFDYNGYGFGTDRDGILFLISMDEREWYISTSGYGITAVTDAGREYMSEKILPYLSDGEYAEAFNVFAEQCDDYITKARAGEAYDVNNIPAEPFSAGGNLLLALVIGLVISLIVTGVMRSGLRSVHSQATADSYVKSGSLRITREHELFLYKNVVRSERPKESSSGSSSSSGGSRTHTSSSGRTHGGGGGKF